MGSVACLQPISVQTAGADTAAGVHTGAPTVLSLKKSLHKIHQHALNIPNTHYLTIYLFLKPSQEIRTERTLQF